jgi:hypothetical protein
MSPVVSEIAKQLPSTRVMTGVVTGGMTVAMVRNNLQSVSNPSMVPNPAATR